MERRLRSSVRVVAALAVTAGALTLGRVGSASAATTTSITDQTSCQDAGGAWTAANLSGTALCSFVTLDVAAGDTLLGGPHIAINATTLANAGTIDADIVGVISASTTNSGTIRATSQAGFLGVNTGTIVAPNIYFLTGENRGTLRADRVHIGTLGASFVNFGEIDVTRDLANETMYPFQNPGTAYLGCGASFGGAFGATISGNPIVGPDCAGPVAGPAVDPVANAAGWNRAPVTVAWNWSDALTRVDPGTCTTSTAVSAEGVSTVSASCSDVVGNSSTTQQVVRIDSVPPTVTAAATTAPDPATGSYSGPVTVHFTCADDAGGSGLAGTCPADQAFTQPGSYTSTVQTVADVAGNVGSSNTVSFTIAPVKVAQAVQFTSTAPSPGVVGTTYAVAASSSAGLPVSVSVDPVSSTVCSIDGSTVSFVAVGSCVLDANQAGNASTLPAVQVQQSITVASLPVFVVATPPVTGTVGQAYTASFTADGSPAPRFGLSGAPGWLTIDPATGAVSGTPPTGATSFSYSVTASNTAGTTSAGPFTVSVTSTTTPNRADLSAIISCPASVARRGLVTCTIVVKNSGPAAALGVVVGAALPEHVSRLTTTPGASRQDNLLYWQVASLSSNATVTYTVTFSPSDQGRRRLAAVALSATRDPNYANNVSFTTLTVTR